MRPSRRRWAMLRLSRLETFEPRIVLSANPAALSLEYAVNNSTDVAVQAAALDPVSTSSLADTRARYGFQGQGQTVAVIDSGIAYDHGALGGGLGAGYRVVGGYDFAEHDANPYDDGPAGAHGTHVAGIIASSDPVYSGVAPGVDLVSLRLFDDNGAGTMAGVEQALRWVHDNRLAFRNPITTVNLSLGTQTNGTSPPAGSILEDELAQLQADGIFVSVAAGNSFTTYMVPGVSYPASSPYVVPVSSVDANGMLSSFSQRSAQTIAAPGRSITSTVPDYVGNHNGVTDDFAQFSGTSMAAPYVAGAAVLLRQAFYSAGIVGVNQDTLYNQMVNTADTVYDPSTGQNYLRLNLTRALDAVMLYGQGSPDPGTLGLYNPSSGSFYLRSSNTSGTADASFSYGPTRSTYVALVGDWNGDGVDTVGLYNPATSTFYLRNSNQGGSSDVTFSYGPAAAGWTPIVGDWNGDGIDTVGLYDSRTSTFYLRNLNSAGTPEVSLAYGSAGDGWQPVVGDWNGDGVETVGLYNPSASTFYLVNSLRGGFADATVGYGPGEAGWLPVAGDFNGDGIDTIGLYAPDSSLFYLRDSNTSGYADRTVGFGAAGAGWRPLVGSWDGRTSAWSQVDSAIATAGTALAPLGFSEFCASQPDSDVAGAVSHAVASMEYQHESSQPDRAMDLASEQRQVDPLCPVPTRSVDPRAVDRVDLATVVQAGYGHLDENDLAAISRGAGSPGESDVVFGEEGLLDTLG